MDSQQQQHLEDIGVSHIGSSNADDGDVRRRRKVSVRLFQQNILSGLLPFSRTTTALGPSRPDVITGYVHPALLPSGHAHIVWEHGENQKKKLHNHGVKSATSSTTDQHAGTTTTKAPMDDQDAPAVVANGVPIIRAPRRVPKIYLGSRGAALPHETSLQTLQEAGIGAIVNCTKDIPCYHRGGGQNNKNDGNSCTIKYAQVAINDVPGADLLTYLPSVTAFIRTCLTHYHVSVLVHCMAGVSRSTSVVLAYLIEYENMSLEDAYVLVKQRRPEIYPNDGFWAQLASYETKCRRQRRLGWIPGKPTHHAELFDDGTGKFGLPPLTSNFNKNNNKSETFNVDQQWIEQSTALYAICRDLNLPDNTLINACFGQVVDYCRDFHALYTKNKNDQPDNHKESEEADQLLDHLLTASLDYIWGRGVLSVECEWLAELCHSLDPLIQNGLFEASTGATLRAASLVANPESEFGSRWTGEVFPQQLGRLLTILHQERAADPE
ncbi:hypothetical protein ACA910_020765 [Epithemia clementina (nom. ined.)]